MTISKLSFYFLFIFLLITLGCSNAFHNCYKKKMYKSIYINQFKLDYFRKLLAKSYYNSAAIQSIIEIDRSGFTEPILTIPDYQLIDSLTTADNNKMIIDSTNSIGTVAEGSKGKHIFGYILNRLDSKWLDSLTKKRYQLARANSSVLD